MVNRKRAGQTFWTASVAWIALASFSVDDANDADILLSPVHLHPLSDFPPLLLPIHHPKLVNSHDAV